MGKVDNYRDIIIVWARLYERIGNGSLQAIGSCFDVVVGKNCISTLTAIKDECKSTLGDVSVVLLRAYDIKPAGQAQHPKEVLIETLASVGEALEPEDGIPDGSFMAVVRPSKFIM